MHLRRQHGWQKLKLCRRFPARRSNFDRKPRTVRHAAGGTAGKSCPDPDTRASWGNADQNAVPVPRHCAPPRTVSARSVTFTPPRLTSPAFPIRLPRRGAQNQPPRGHRTEVTAPCRVLPPIRRRGVRDMAAGTRARAWCIAASRRSHSPVSPTGGIAAPQVIALAAARSRSSAIAARQTGELIEVAADDAAIRREHRLTLAGALLAVATAGVPAGALEPAEPPPRSASGASSTRPAHPAQPGGRSRPPPWPPSPSWRWPHQRWP